MRSIHPHIGRPYAVINWIFVIIIAGIFVYSAVYDPDTANHPIPSGYQLLTGENTISTGLSRSFSALVRLRFADATKKQQGMIELVDSQNTIHKVKVPVAMMGDIVRPMFDYEVIVKGKRGFSIFSPCEGEAGINHTNRS